MSDGGVQGFWVHLRAKSMIQLGKGGILVDSYESFR